MPTKDAMLVNPIRGKMTDTVSETLEVFEKNSIKCIPVVDDNDIVVGLFNFRHLLMDLLPVALDHDDKVKRYKSVEISLDHLDGQAPWVARRLEIMLPKTLGEVMLKEPIMLHPDTPLREAIRLMVQHGSPLPVVDQDTKKLLGVISSQCAISALLKMKTDMRRGKSTEEIQE
jgi:CBS domain-containing protein